MPVEIFKCPNCSAPLPVALNTPLTTCAYCHSTVRITTGTPDAQGPSAEAARLDEISQALARLLKRSNEDAFVIFVESRSQKFVQFVGSANEPLFLDLPSQTLSAEEMERAIALFSDLGARAEEHDLYTDKTMKKKAGKQISFNLDLGHEVQRAAQITLTIFRQVYGFPLDFQLVIKEN